MCNVTPVTFCYYPCYLRCRMEQTPPPPPPSVAYDIDGNQVTVLRAATSADSDTRSPAAKKSRSEAESSGEHQSPRRSSRRSRPGERGDATDPAAANAPPSLQDTASAPLPPAGADLVPRSLYPLHLPLAVPPQDGDQRVVFMRDVEALWKYFNASIHARRVSGVPSLCPDWGNALRRLMSRIVTSKTRKPRGGADGIMPPFSFPCTQQHCPIMNVRWSLPMAVLIFGCDVTDGSPWVAIEQLLIQDEFQLRMFLSRFENNVFMADGKIVTPDAGAIVTRTSEFPVPHNYRRQTVALLCGHVVHRHDWHLLCVVCSVLLVRKPGAVIRPCHLTGGCPRCAALDENTFNLRKKKFTALMALPLGEVQHERAANRLVTDQLTANFCRLVVITAYLRLNDLAVPQTVNEALLLAERIRTPLYKSGQRPGQQHYSTAHRTCHASSRGTTSGGSLQSGVSSERGSGTTAAHHGDARLGICPRGRLPPSSSRGHGLTRESSARTTGSDQATSFAA